MRTLTGVGKRYGRGPFVFEGVDLDIGPGQVIAVVGGNGSGKSTLLRVVAGLARPSAGTLGGSPRTGYVPDRFPGAQRLSALAYLAHMGRIGGLSGAEARRRGLHWLDRLSLAGGPDTPLRALSKGNAQKVAIAQALLAEPPLVVLDEPFSGLDAGSHAVLADIIAETRERGASVVFTEHRSDRALAHATHSLRLAGGRLRPLGETAAAGDRVEPTARIVLTGADPERWRHEPGVLAVTGCGDHAELTVPGGACDPVLLLALRRGCSVRRVERGGA